MIMRSQYFELLERLRKTTTSDLFNIQVVADSQQTVKLQLAIFSSDVSEMQICNRITSDSGRCRDEFMILEDSHFE